MESLKYQGNFIKSLTLFLNWLLLSARGGESWKNTKFRLNAYKFNVRNKTTDHSNTHIILFSAIIWQNKKIYIHSSFCMHFKSISAHHITYIILRASSLKAQKASSPKCENQKSRVVSICQVGSSIHDFDDLFVQEQM